MSRTGTVIGYDPGGNDKHGVAHATIRDGRIQARAANAGASTGQTQKRHPRYGGDT